MGKIRLDLLKERIIERYDSDYLVDVLRITPEELIDAFEDKLLERVAEFTELEDNDD